MAPPDPIPVLDAHVDSLQVALDLGDDLATGARGHLDLPRARRGGLVAAVLVSWCDPVFLDPERGGARRRTERLLGRLHELLREHPSALQWIGNGTDLDRARAEGAFGAIAGIEGGHSIEESLDTLERFFAFGVRVMTLVWNNHLPWIRSCQEGAGAGVPEGLSDFGRDVVRRMNELGMVVDVAHAGERSFYDALETSDRAVLASHSGCRALHDHPRNLSDEQLSALAERGGVVGIVFCTAFLDAAARDEERRLRRTPAFAGLGGRNETERWLSRARFLQHHASPLPLARVIDHVLHAVDVAGVEHVAIGSDFDGIERTPAGLEDASCYPNLARGLAERGLSDVELRAVLGGNLERVFRAASGPGTRAAKARLEPLSPGPERIGPERIGPA